MQSMARVGEEGGEGEEGKGRRIWCENVWVYVDGCMYVYVEERALNQKQRKKTCANKV
jgi:hypothetical protein